MIVIEPGVVRTEIWDEGASGAGRYADTDYAELLARFGEYAQELAKTVSPQSGSAGSSARSSRRGRQKTKYAIVPGKLANFTVPRLLPDRWLDRLIARNVGLT